MSICVFNLPIFVAIIFVTFACHFEYRVNWPAKSLQSKSIVKIGTLNLRRKALAKISTLNLQKKALSRFSALPNEDLTTTTRLALNTWSTRVSICFRRNEVNLQILALPFFADLMCQFFAYFFCIFNVLILQCFFFADF